MADPGAKAASSLQDQDEIGSNHKKRGMKPRSKRNRKRARSERHEMEDSIQHTVRILPLELDGRRIPSSTEWIRIVEPYPYTFSTYAKARWLGRTVLDVYSTEFGSYPESYYESAISQGRILVSDQQVNVDHVIRGNDVLTHTVHRHEPGVAVSLPESPHVNIIEETEDVLVVDKPGTLPIHPCGGYHTQSLMNLLEPKYGKLYTIHRLDRLTCGLVILGKTSAIATEWGKLIMNRDCKKVYLARVAGKFPLNCPQALARIVTEDRIPDHGEWPSKNNSSGKKDRACAEARNLNAYGHWITDNDGRLENECGLDDIYDSQYPEDVWLGCKDDGLLSKLRWFHLACPTRIAHPKDGICEAGSFDDLEDSVYLKTVKPAETSFGVVWYDPVSDSTLVVCRPRTGRTHQIRLHLQHLGHPIANDPNYGGDIWYGNADGKNSCLVAQSRLDAIAMSNQDDSEKKTDDEVSAMSTIDVPATEGEIQRGVTAATRGNEEFIHDFIRRTCVWCARSQNTIGDTPRDILEFLVRSPGIWLQAYQYTFNDSKGNHTFRAPIPQWAKLTSAS